MSEITGSDIYPNVTLNGYTRLRRSSSTLAYSATTNLYSSAGDFNNDGIVDYVTPPLSGTSLVLRFGRTDGTFSSEQLIPVGGDPRTVVSGDLTGDGRPDFVAGHLNGMSLVTATGPTAYAPARELAPGGRVESIFMADFNNDSQLDIAALLWTGKTLVVYLNAGGGNFGATTTLALPDEAQTLVAGDLNGDSRPDLIFTTNPTFGGTPVLMAALNNGTGAFTSVLSSPLPETANYLGINDVNSDGRLDAVVRLANGLISIHLGDGAGRFNRRSVHSGGYAFKTGFDFYDDTSVNRFLVTPGTGTILLRATTFNPDGSLDNTPAVGFPGFTRNARVADFNNDTQPDIIAAGDGGFGRVGGLWVRLKQGDTYAPAIAIGSLKPSAIEIADVNGDNRPDIVALESTGTGATASIALNNGNGTFAAPVKIWDQPDNNFTSYNLLVSDWNNDQRPDIAFVGDTSIYTLVNTGNASFRAPATLAVPNRTFNVILGDINSDGRQDMLVMTGQRTTVLSGRNPVLVRYLAQADGTFSTASDVLTSKVNAVGRVLAVIDINKDNLPDVVYSATPDLSADSVRIQLGQPGGGFVEGKVFGGNSILFADVDGDGRLDAVGIGSNRTFYRGRGDGTFGNPLILPDGTNLATANLNNDNKTDFISITPGLESFVLPLPSDFTPQNNADVVSAASSQLIPAAPASIVSVYGTGLATGTEATPSPAWPTTLAGTTATVQASGGVRYPAQLAYASPGQVNLLIPKEVPFDITATIQITSSSGTISNGLVQISKVSPGIFNVGASLAAANLLRVRAGVQTIEPVVTIENGQLVALPIDLGPATDQLFLLLYGTGIRGRFGLNAVSATIGGVTAPVTFAGDQGQFPGVDQINVQLPRSLAGRGIVDVVLKVESTTANTIRIAVK
ncbi:MAG: FG-GAP-like repeat-containing protein [Bryobacteraceae bacterium]